MNLSQNTLKAIIRSLTPWALSLIAGVVAHFGWHPSLALEVKIVGIGGAGLTVAVHALEVKFPWVGVFLGWLGAPKYAPSAKNALIAELQKKVDALTPPTPAPAPAGSTPVATEVAPAPVAGQTA
jgi:hypothetical protein